MNLKQYVRYQMDFHGSWAQPSAVLMGLSFFLRIVHFFGFNFLSQWTFADVVFEVMLPLLICGAYVVLIRALQWNAPGLYGIMGGSLCVLCVFWSFSSGNVLQIIFSVLIYLAAGVVLVATAGGYLPSRKLSSVLLFIAMIIEVFQLKLSIFALGVLVLDASVLCTVASLFCLTFCFREIKTRTTKK